MVNTSEIKSKAKKMIVKQKPNKQVRLIGLIQAFVYEFSAPRKNLRNRAPGPYHELNSLINPVRNNHSVIRRINDTM